MNISGNELRHFPSLTDLSDSEREEVATILDPMRYRKGAQVVREGGEGESACLLYQGSVTVTKRLEDGRTVRLAELSPGALFGQTGLLDDQVRTANVNANEEVVILHLPKVAFDWALNRQLPWAVAIQRLVATHLVRQLRSALDRLEDLALSEHPEDAALGRTKDSIQQPQALDVDLSAARRRKKQKAADESIKWAKGDQGDGTEAKPLNLPPVPGPELDPETTLLSLLAATEASLANAGVETDGVKWVMDEDQRRTVEARLAGSPGGGDL